MPTFSAARADHEFRDAWGVTIHWYVWRAAKPRGVVQLVHGVGEHALRYEHVAQALVGAGYTVYADDHRGHGATGLEQWGGDASRLGRLGPGGLRAAVDAVEAFADLVRAEEPGLPFGVVAHSWGSLVAQQLLDERPDLWDAVVLTGTAYRMPGSMAAGDLNRRHAQPDGTGFEWISRDPAVQEAMAADPLVVDARVLQLFGLADTLRLLGRPRRHYRHDVPLSIVVGSDDALGGERSAVKLAKAYVQRSGLTDVEVRVYDGARHEVLNETNRDEVIGDVVRWLDLRLGAVAGATPAAD